MTDPTESDYEQTYAWGWFAYHAGQRLTAFNFFVVVLGAILVAYVQAADAHLRGLGVALGIVGILISLAFWVIDVRNTELVICGRAALDALEARPNMSITIRADDRDRKWLKSTLQGPVEGAIFSGLRPAGTRNSSVRGPRAVSKARGTPSRLNAAVAVSWLPAHRRRR
jgi:hypothetical protein